MRYYELKEGRNHPCIVVDVQPAYWEWSKLIAPRIISFVANQTGPVLMFINAEDTGLTNDSLDDIKLMWEEEGFNPEDWHRVEIVDKGYGYLRSWMDQGVSNRAIIKTVREMYSQHVDDSRMLFSEWHSKYDHTDEERIAWRKFIGWDFEEWMLDDGIHVGWTSIAQLKRYNGAYIMGGGRNQCLREVELLMNAFNIRYKRINKLIYG